MPPFLFFTISDPNSPPLLGAWRSWEGNDHSPSGEPIAPEAAPKLIIPETMSHFYLIVTSDPENPITPIRVKPIDAGPDTLRYGETLWFNLTDHAIAGKLGSQALPGSPIAIH